MVLVGLLVGLGACTKAKNNTAPLPAGDELLRGAAAEMRNVKTAHFLVEVEGSVAGLAFRRADGVLTREGDAKGTVQTGQAGSTLELSFVIVGGKLYVKGPTGGYQQLPLALATGVYDPSVILNPDKGVAKLLETAQGARTEARETVGGKDTYRVAAKPDIAVLGPLLPGVTGDVTAQLWIGVDRKVVHKAKFAVPGQQGSAAGAVTVTLSDFDAPVTISAP